MPQLPSGLQVGLDPRPLSELLKNAAHFGNIHKVMAINTTRDLYPHIDIVLLVPETETNANGATLEFADDALPRPPGLVPVSSGYRLSQWNELARQWSEEDKAAFESFLAGRAQSLFDDGLAMAREIQELLRNADDFNTRVLVGWWDAGCHPAQEEGWGESDVGATTWDDYDLLAALGQVHAATQAHPDFSGSQPSMRLAAFWGLCCRLIPELHNWPDPAAPVRSVAEGARGYGWLERLSETDRAWLHRQAVAECVCLWGALGDDFRPRFPQPYGIVELVIVSSEANEFFDGKASALRPEP
jgi:hypothetical protein